MTALSSAAFRHFPTNERQASGPFPVKEASFARPSRNNRDRGSAIVVSPEPLGSELSVSVSVFCTLSLGGVTVTVSVTAVTELRTLSRCRFCRVAFVGSVTSLLYWRPCQLWGSNNPSSRRSNNPAMTSSAIAAAARWGVVRSFTATILRSGSAPSCNDAMHIRLNHARWALSLSRISLGSSTASS